MNEFMWNCFSPIFKEISSIYQVSDLSVTMLSLSYMIIFAPASFLFVYIQVRYGLRKTLIIGATLQAIGGFIRYLSCLLLQANTDKNNVSSGYFGLLMIGQIFAAFAQPVFTNLPPLISTTWFPAHERNRATITMVMANPIGNALGSLVPGLVIPVLTMSSTENDKDHIRSNLVYFAFAQAILATIIATGIIVTVQDKPPTPPSAAAAVREEKITETLSSLPTSSSSYTKLMDTEEEQLLDTSKSSSSLPSSSSSAAKLALSKLYNEYKLLYQNKNFLYLLIGFGIGLGTFNAILALLGQIVSPCGYTSTQAGITGGILLGSGLLTSGIIGTYLEKSKALVPVLRISIIIALIMLTIFLIFLRPNIPIGLYITSGILGAAVVPILPVGLENAAECTYPILEDTSASAMTMFGKYLGVIITFILQPLLSLSMVSTCSTIFTPTAGIILGLLIISAVCIYRFQKDYRRQQTETVYVNNEK